MKHHHLKRPQNLIRGRLKIVQAFVLLCWISSVPAIAVGSEYESDIRQEAYSGDAESQFALALLYEYGSETIVRDPEQSVLWLDKAGQEGVAGACLYLGLKYEHGNTVQQDYSKAVCWYRCAAQQDWPVAQFFLSRLYELGKGVSPSPIIALAWLGLAAEQGYPGSEAEFTRLMQVTGFNDMVQLKAKQEILLRGKRISCN